MKYSIKNFRKDFPNDDRCLDYIFKARFPDVKGFNREKSTKRYTHQKGSESISPMAGTIFEGTTVPLTLWFHAMYLFSVSKNGVSAKELERQLGVNYKTAWRIAAQIRKLMEQDKDQLTGIVEIDEAFIAKTPVVGAVSRTGKVKVKVVSRIAGGTIVGHVIRSVDVKSELMSDKNQAYKHLDRYYKRESINHSNKEYVRGRVHVNTMESFWSNVKRSITGTHHFVSPKHLQSYLDYFAFQQECRTFSLPPFLVLLNRACESLGAKA